MSTREDAQRQFVIGMSEYAGKALADLEARGMSRRDAALFLMDSYVSVALTVGQFASMGPRESVDYVYQNIKHLWQNRLQMPTLAQLLAEAARQGKKP